MSLQKSRYGLAQLLRVRAGFTLIEMLVVAIIIGLLATIVIPNIPKILGGTKIKLATTGMASLATVLNTYMFDCGTFPTTEQGLIALKEKPASAPEHWNGPYTESQLTDPWGNPYQYRSPGQDGQRDYDLWSSGPDGKSGTTDDIVHLGKK